MYGVLSAELWRAGINRVGSCFMRSGAATVRCVCHDCEL